MLYTSSNKTIVLFFCHIFYSKIRSGVVVVIDKLKAIFSKAILYASAFVMSTILFSKAFLDSFMVRPDRCCLLLMQRRL